MSDKDGHHDGWERAEDGDVHHGEWRARTGYQGKGGNSRRGTETWCMGWARAPFAMACVAILFPFPTAMVSGFGNDRSYESTAAWFEILGVKLYKFEGLKFDISWSICFLER